MNENLEQNQRKRLIRNEWTVLWSHTRMGENSFLPAIYSPEEIQKSFHPKSCSKLGFPLPSITMNATCDRELTTS